MVIYFCMNVKNIYIFKLNNTLNNTDQRCGEINRGGLIGNMRIVWQTHRQLDKLPYWLIVFVIAWLSPGRSLDVTKKVNYLCWQLNWPQPEKKRKKKGEVASSFFVTSICLCAPKVTGRSVFLLTHQFFRALHIECSSDFEYGAYAYTSALFLSDMTSSNAQWKLKERGGGGLCINSFPI